MSKQKQCVFILSESSSLVWMLPLFDKIKNEAAIATYDFQEREGIKVFPFDSTAENVISWVINNKFSHVVLLSNQSGLTRDLNIATHLKKHGIRVISQGSKATEIGINKIKMKQFLLRYGFPTPDYRIASSLVEAIKYASKLSFPVILKVSGLSEGRKMALVHSKDEIAKYYYENAIMEPVIVEKFIHGEEVSTIVYNNFGNALVFPVTHKPTTDYLFKSANTRNRVYVSPQYKTTSLDKDVQNLALKLAKKINNQLFLGLDIVVDKGGEPLILEFNARVTETLRMSMILVQMNILENLYFIKQEIGLKNHTLDAKGYVADVPVSPSFLDALKKQKIKVKYLAAVSNTRISLFAKSFESVQKVVKQVLNLNT